MLLPSRNFTDYNKFRLDVEQMKTFLRTLMFIGLVVLTVHTMIRMRHNGAVSRGGSFARLHRAEGHVLRPEPKGGAVDVEQLCFSIDGFPDLPESERNFYEIHERAWVAAHGARCLTVSGSEAVHKLHSGDRLEVFYASANGAEIAIDHLAAQGEKL